MHAKALVAAFNSWGQEAAHSAELRGRLTGALARWRDQAMAAAFEAFIDNWEARQHARRVIRCPTIICMRSRKSRAAIF